MDSVEVLGSDPDDESRDVPSKGEAAESEGPQPTEADRSSENQVVARFLDGKVIKGYTWNFSPNKPRFHVFPAAPDDADRPVEVWFKDLKAVFFVRDFAGSSQYEERKEFAEGERAPGHTLEVTFVDGEVLVGSTLGYDPQRLGFFLFPVDYESNNVRIFIVFAAVKKVRRV